MGIEPYLLASSVLAVLAQRLLRTICEGCKTAYEPTDEELSEIMLERKDLKKGTLFKGAGCEMCFDSGYRGRHGIYELMPVTEEIKRQLILSADATKLQKIAYAEGMHSLKQAGGRLAALGTTSATEVLRVTR